MISLTDDKLRIGEVAEQAGLRKSAIRYYEAIGLLPEPERISGQRVYEPERPPPPRGDRRVAARRPDAR